MENPQEHSAPHLGRNIVIGALTLAPLWVTWLVFDFVLGLLYRVGSPGVAALARLIQPVSQSVADALLQPWFRFVLAVLITLATLYAVGWAANRVIGRRLIARLEAALQRVPLVQAIYGATKRFIAAVRERPAGLQRVVLINFPSQQMKAIGFVTRVMRDPTSGREMAAVYVPTSPNPTSGYIEIVPLADVIATDWSVEEAMSFIMTGGTNSPPHIHFDAPYRGEDAGGGLAPDGRGT